MSIRFDLCPLIQIFKFVLQIFEMDCDTQINSASYDGQFVIKIKKSGLDTISWSKEREMALLNQVIVQKFI